MTDQPIEPTIHHLKVWPEFIPALEDGSKTFEARKDDRAFRVGDVLCLYGWDRDAGRATGWEQNRLVTYKLSGPAWGVESGHCILGLSPLEDSALTAELAKERARADEWVKSVTDAVVAIAFDSGACVPKDTAVDYYAGNSSKAMRDLEWYARKAIALRPERDIATRQREEMRADLSRFGRHSDGCDQYRIGRCTCGLSAALANNKATT